MTFTEGTLCTCKQFTKITKPKLASIAAIQHNRKKNHDDHATVRANKSTINNSRLISTQRILVLFVLRTLSNLRRKKSIII